MIFRGPVRVIAGLSCALLAIVAIAWSVLWLWQSAAEIDRNPSRNGLQAQMMHPKTTAMQAISYESMRTMIGSNIRKCRLRVAIGRA